MEDGSIRIAKAADAAAIAIIQWSRGGKPARELSRVDQKTAT
jgi:hypothetical protein